MKIIKYRLEVGYILCYRFYFKGRK